MQSQLRKKLRDALDGAKWGKFYQVSQIVIPFESNTKFWYLKKILKDSINKNIDIYIWIDLWIEITFSLMTIKVFTPWKLVLEWGTSIYHQFIYH